MNTDSSFSSLMALVDSHLSKTSVKTIDNEVPDERVHQIPRPGCTFDGTMSETRLTLSPGPRMALPTLSLSESPIQEVLAKQVNNMLKAKEKQKQLEEATRLSKQRDKLTEEMKNLKMQDDQNDTMIDLVKAVKESLHVKTSAACLPKEDTISSSSSFESLFEPKCNDCLSEPDRVRTPEPLLACNTDMSYILKQRVKEGRCSTFGKVLTSRMKPNASPYLRQKTVTKVVRFDFSTKSPCDLIKEKLRQPIPCANRTFDLYSIFPDLET